MKQSAIESPHQPRTKNLVTGCLFDYPDPSIGLVIGTFASVPYVHLHLETRRRHYPQIPVLVHDDASPQGEQLKALCAEYGADFMDTPETLGHSIGDLSVFAHGFDWAKDRGLDLLVKMSRRFMPVVNWVPELLELAYRTQYATYGNHCTAQGWGLRTECAAFHVSSWVDAGAVDEIRRLISKREGVDFIENVIHSLARAVHAAACPQNKDYEKARPKAAAYSGYGDWKFVNSSRNQKSPDALWHQPGTCDPVDYCRALRQYGISYPVSAFSDVNGASANGLHADYYEQAKRQPSDINEHLETLARLAADCCHVTELGTRSGVSTTALLYAWPKTLISYDRDYQHGLGHLEQIARDEEVEFVFVQADVLTIEIEETDLLFIDTWHTYDQLSQELALHGDKARKYLVFHDTTTFGFTGEGPGTIGLWPAIREFLESHSEWELVEKYQHNNGLTVLRRCRSQSSAEPVSEEGGDHPEEG